MEIILKEDILSLGHKDDIITVKNGYARNYLIPKGLAINATASARKMHEETLRQRAHKEAKLVEESSPEKVVESTCNQDVEPERSSYGDNDSGSDSGGYDGGDCGGDCGGGD